MAAIVDGPVTLTADHISKIFGASTDAGWFPVIKAACDERSINTIFRLSAFLANVKVESGSLKTLTENLNYSASRLVAVFPKYFPTLDSTNGYAGNPTAIASKVYGGRLGNGLEASGDGYTYRGRGCIQLTGKSNYDACTRGGVSCLGSNSDYLVSQEGAIRSAAWFWNSKGLNQPADAADFDTVCRRINGGTNGLADRQAAYQLCLITLSGLPDDTAVNITPADPGTAGDNQLQVVKKDPSAIAPVDASHQTIQEPIVGGKAQYPYNQVFESRAGHLIEIDDSPGLERLHWYHKSGTYTEMHPNGDHITKAVHDGYYFVMGNAFRDIKGDITYKIGGQSYEKVGSTKVIEASGSITLTTDDTIQLNAPIVNAKQILNVPIINCQMITMTPGDEGLGPVGNLKVRDSVHADYADGCQYAVLSGGFGGGSINPNPSSQIGGSWNRERDSKGSATRISYKPISSGLEGTFVRVTPATAEDLISQVVGDHLEAIEGSSYHDVNGNIERQSGGDVLDHNMGTREIASAEDFDIHSEQTLTISSSKRIKIDAPVIEFAPVDCLIMRPSSIDSLPEANEKNAGCFLIYVDKDGNIQKAKSDGKSWTILGGK